jgi:Zn-dependent protease with chaperone function
MNQDQHDGFPLRSPETNIKLVAKGIDGNLALASAVTLSLIGGMVLVLVLTTILILDSENSGLGLVISIVITLLFNVAAFFIAPWLMDLSQQWLYQTRWVSLGEIADRSPETAKIIRKFCADKKIKHPRLGIIDDQNPTAFTYGSLPNSARLVVSQGLFTYLDDEEIATVYAHELGHIAHWDFAVMTIASTLIQICYLIYIFARRMSNRGSEKVQDAFQTAALVAYIFYIIGSYLLLYLSRIREYFADRFAAEVTGNPNALSRALVKIAYGIVEETSKAEQSSHLLEGTRALGIYDPKAATGTAYRIASSPEKIGRVFLWDLFNPWGWWMELNSTHPLTGKRVRALSTYAEQLGLKIEFDMGKVVGEGKHLNKKRLYGNFATDILLYSDETSPKPNWVRNFCPRLVSSRQYALDGSSANENCRWDNC